MRIVLGSASPRRQELLKKIYQDFIIDPADVKEDIPEDIGAEFAPIFLAAIKSEALKDRYPNDLVITADTVVIADGEIFGKPKNLSDARRMLTALSGKTHKVITGCCVTLNGESRCFSEESLVTFYPLNNEEIETYLASGEPMGKAGAYAIQERGCLFVEKIDGDYFNIVGLPIARIYREICDFKKELGL